MGQDVAPGGLYLDRLADALKPLLHLPSLHQPHSGPEGQLVVAWSELGRLHIPLRRRRVIALARQIITLSGDGVGVAQVQQPLELGERLGVILDPQLEGSLPPLPLTGDDQQRRGLAPASIATRLLAGEESGQKPPRELSDVAS